MLLTYAAPMRVWPQVRADIAASFQRVALGHLEERVARAAQWALAQHPAMRHLVVAGGVAANQLLRAKLQARAAQWVPELPLESTACRVQQEQLVLSKVMRYHETAFTCCA